MYLLKPTINWADLSVFALIFFLSGTVATAIHRKQQIQQPLILMTLSLLAYCSMGIMGKVIPQTLDLKDLLLFMSPIVATTIINITGLYVCKINWAEITD